MRYIGFDMGDGESAVAILEHGSGIEPIVQELCGSKSILSAVGKSNGEIVIGEQAYTSSLADDLAVRFKSRFTYDTASYETVSLFVRGVLKALQSGGTLYADDCFVVGCPAGWNAACRARYQDILHRAGIQRLQVISESRAAFLYAKYAKTVALDIDVIRQSALVVDIGSSTLDFAYIVNGRETGVGTFGDIALGGGLLDAELLRRAVAENRQRKELESVFAQSRSWYSYCEIEARRVKEQYFTQAAADPKASVKKQVRVCYEGTQRLTLAMDARMEALLVDTPLESLGGQSFSQAVRAALEHARTLTQSDPPKVVLLTGGASRMQFFRALCAEAFPDAVIVCCPEPEFSIAKGLAYAGWIDENLKAFREEIRREVTDERVAQIATTALPKLTPAVVDALVDLVVEEAAIPVATLWKNGEIETLEQMNQRLSERVERVMASPLCEDALRPVLSAWVTELESALQAMIDPICDRYSVPREEMRLRLSQAGQAKDIRIGAQELMGFNLIGTLVGLVVSVLCGLLCGGGGITLVAAGPLGFLAGVVIGALVAALGWPQMVSLMMKANLPRPLRWMNVKKRLGSEKTRRTLRDALLKKLGAKDSDFSRQVIAGFTSSFQEYLRSIAQAAEIPIE